MAQTITPKTGRKWNKKGQTPKEYREKRNAEVDDMMTALKEWEVEQSDAFLAELTAKFDNYHGHNPALIEMNSGGLALDVDARGAWFERDRTPIGKGTGIRIVSPIMRKLDDPDNPGKKIMKPVGYRIAWVFDWRHTTPKDLVNQWKLDHPADETGARHWGDEAAIKAWHDLWEPIPGNA